MRPVSQNLSGTNLNFSFQRIWYIFLPDCKCTNALFEIRIMHPVSRSLRITSTSSRNVACPNEISFLPSPPYPRSSVLWLLHHIQSFESEREERERKRVGIGITFQRENRYPDGPSFFSLFFVARAATDHSLLVLLSVHQGNYLLYRTV